MFEQSAESTRKVIISLVMGASCGWPVYLIYSRTLVYSVYLLNLGYSMEKNAIRPTAFNLFLRKSRTKLIDYIATPFVAGFQSAFE